MAKATQPLEKLSKRMTWIPSFPPMFVRFIAICEILGGIGLIIPAVTGVWRWLTPVAAIGLAIIMAGAVGTHLLRKEYPNMGATVVLFLLTVIIAVGRFSIVPFI